MLRILTKHGQFAESPPRVVLEWIPTGDVKPTGKFAALAVALHVLECRVIRSAVIEHAVDDDAKSHSFGFANEV